MIDFELWPGLFFFCYWCLLYYPYIGTTTTHNRTHAYTNPVFTFALHIVYYRLIVVRVHMCLYWFFECVYRNIGYFAVLHTGSAQTLLSHWTERWVVIVVPGLRDRPSPMNNRAPSDVECICLANAVIGQILKVKPNFTIMSCYYYASWKVFLLCSSLLLYCSGRFGWVYSITNARLTQAPIPIR